MSAPSSSSLIVLSSYKKRLTSAATAGRESTQSATKQQDDIVASVTTSTPQMDLRNGEGGQESSSLLVDSTMEENNNTIAESGNNNETTTTTTAAMAKEDDDDGDGVSNDNSISPLPQQMSRVVNDDSTPLCAKDICDDAEATVNQKQPSSSSGPRPYATHHRAYSDISPILSVDRPDRSGLYNPATRRPHLRQNSDSVQLMMSSDRSDEHLGLSLLAPLECGESSIPRSTIIFPSISKSQTTTNGGDVIIDTNISSTKHHPMGIKKGSKANGNGNSNVFGSSRHHNKPFRPKSIQFQTLRYDVPVKRRTGGIRFCGDKKSILKSVNGEFKAGQLHAILGPSGAGKSTLMNVLAGYKMRHMTGTVLVNGKPRDSSKFRKMSCYIMQDDYLLLQLTVIESMMCSANLKLEEKVPLSEKREAIFEILETLGLHEQVHTRVGNLSGGQRKRLSIALELINNPPIMFLDEPTSGLDSVSCFQCVQLLKRLALGGRNIICTIHQPSAKVFEIFDTVFVMAEGQAMYDGPFSCIVPYFALHNIHCPPYHNPSDFVMEVATGDYGDVVPTLTHWSRSGKAQTEILKLLKSSSKRSIATQTAPGVNSSTTGSMFQTTGAPSETADTDQACSSGSRAPSLMDSDNASQGKGEQSSLNDTLCKRGRCSGTEQPRNFATSLFTQFRILFIRTFLSIMRDSTLTQVRLLTHLFIAILIGMMYLEIGNDASKVVNNAASLFFTCLFLNFGALMPTILTFPSEVLVFLREHLNFWYSLKSYYLAKTAADMPFQVVLPIVYTVIVYFMTGQPYEFLRFFLFTTIMVLTSFVAQSLGLLISAMSRAEIAVFLGPITVIPLLLFSGFLASFDTMPKYLTYLSYFSYLRYSFEGSMMAIYGFNRTGLSCDGMFATADNPEGPPSGTYSMERIQSCVMFSKGDAVLKSFGLHDVNVTLDIVALIAFFIFFRLACYCALRWRVFMSK